VRETKPNIYGGFVMEIYEVDLRDRKTGNSVECIYSGDDHNEACRIADNWNKEHLADYNNDFGFDDYVDGETEGISADVYVIDNEADLHRVGKFEY
jgi:hypothetical protein